MLARSSAKPAIDDPSLASPDAKEDFAENHKTS
jgi:hypothetical protein